MIWKHLRKYINIEMSCNVVSLPEKSFKSIYDAKKSKRNKAQ